MKTIPEQFKETAQKFAKRPALKFKYQGAYIAVSFSELQERVLTMAKGLQSLGVNKGDRVAILSENRTEWVRADLATLTLGAISVPIHTTLSALLIKHIVNDSGAKILVVSNQEQFNKILLVAAELPTLTTIIYIDLHQPQQRLGNTAVLSLTDVMKAGEMATVSLQTAVAPNDVASIVYTSGTTAVPKGVMLTHQNFMFDAQAALTVVPVTERDTFLSFLPLSHVFERTAGYYAPLICAGACIAYAEDIKTLAKNLREIKPTIFVSVPRVFEKIHKGIWEKVKPAGSLKYKLFVWSLKQVPGTFGYIVADRIVFHKIRHQLGGRFRLTISGGSSLNHKLGRFFERMKITIIEGYGLTETAPIATANRPGHVKFGTVGQHLPGVEVVLAADKEILVRGPNIMKGYYNNQVLTDEVIDQDGWFHTGDLGFIDGEGFVTIVGRKKEMISLSNGKVVWPEQLELLLNNDRLISQSLVYGAKRQFITALIVPDWQEVTRELGDTDTVNQEPDRLVLQPALLTLMGERIDQINRQLADWEKIKRFVLLPREFSQEKDQLTPTLKLRRPVIAQQFQKQIERLYRT